LRSVRVLKNVMTNYLRFFLSGVIGFVLTPIMVRLMGDGDYGLWVTVFSLTGYFGLFDQGIRPSLVRYVSRDHTLGDDAGLSRTINSAIALYTSVGALTLVATGVVAATLHLWFKVEPAQVPVARQIVWLFGLSLALGFPLGVFGATLSGLQRYDIANGIGMLIGVLRAVAFVVVLRLGGGLIGLAWASLVTNLLGYVLSALFVFRLLPRVRYGPRHIDGPHLRLIGSYSGFAFVGALATSIAFQTDALVITGFLGAALVTPFALASGLVDNARSLVYSATWVLAPTASELETRGEQDKLHTMLVAGSKYSVLLAWPVLLGLIVFGPNLLETWVGKEYRSASLLLTILTVPTLIALPQSTASSVLYGISRHRGMVALSLLNAVLNLGLSLLWVKPFGNAGVAMGTAVPLGLVSGVATMVYACRALKMPLGRYTWEGMVRPGLLTLVFLAPALLVQWRWHPVGWLPLFGTCAGAWVLFAVVAWRWGVDDDERARWSRMMPGLFRPRTPAAEAGR
jgi:O-antigen/teichoic acid export membrane protein